MENELQLGIEVLVRRVEAKETELNQLKRVVNGLCHEAGLPDRYTITEGKNLSSIRSDRFYGKSLGAAIREYLEIRKASGLSSASALDIYKAVKEGGYKFETEKEENQKISVSNTLRKSSSIFHKLPNGEYGLLIWYPSAKAQSDSVSEEKDRETDKELPKTEKPKSNDSSGLVTNEEIRSIVLAQPKPFKVSDIESQVRAQYPKKELPKPKVATVIFLLKKKDLIRETSPKAGSRPAVYTASSLFTPVATQEIYPKS